MPRPRTRHQRSLRQQQQTRNAFEDNQYDQKHYVTPSPPGRYQLSSLEKCSPASVQISRTGKDTTAEEESRPRAGSPARKQLFSTTGEEIAPIGSSNSPRRDGILYKSRRRRGWSQASLFDSLASLASSPPATSLSAVKDGNPRKSDLNLRTSAVLPENRAARVIPTKVPKLTKLSVTNDGPEKHQKQTLRSPSTPQILPIGTTRRQGENIIPPQLVSLLAPKGIKSTLRLPQSQQDVYRQALARMKKMVPPRKRLPRKCKSRTSGSVSYVEDSDSDDQIAEQDDLSYWDSQIRKQQEQQFAKQNHQKPKHRTISTIEQSTRRPRTRAFLAKISNASLRQQAEQEAGSTGADLMPPQSVLPVRPKRGRPPKKATTSSMPIGGTMQPPTKKQRKRGRPSKAKNSATTSIEQAKTSVRRVLWPEDESPSSTSDRATLFGKSDSLNQKQSSRRKRMETSCGPKSLTRKQRYKANSGVSMIKPKFKNDALEIPCVNNRSKEEPQESMSEIIIPQRNFENSGQNASSQSNLMGAPARKTNGLEAVRPIVNVKRRSHHSSSVISKASRVRFAPLPSTTTTFSVKIRVRTSTSPSKKDKKGSNHHLLSPPALSESAVQSIANQITQACLAQAPQASGKMDHSISRQDFSNVSNKADITTEIAAASTSDDESDSESDTSSTSERERATSIQEVAPTLHNDQFRPPRNIAERNQIVPMPDFPEKRRGGHDNVISFDQDAELRSVASEITMDIDLTRGDTSNTNIRIGEGGWMKGARWTTTQAQREHNQRLIRGEDREEHIPVVQMPRTVKQQLDVNQKEGASSLIYGNQNVGETSYPLRQEQDDISTNLGKAYQDKASAANPRWASTDSLAGSGLSCSRLSSKKSRYNSNGFVSPETSRRQRRRTLTCNDSLAGCSLASINSFVAPFKVPKEVSVSKLQRMPRKTGLGAHYPAMEDKMNKKSTAATDHNRPNLENVDETVVTNQTTDTRRSSAWSVADGRCGRCPGCRQEFDCLTCTKCLASLQAGINPSQGTGCLKRMCKVLRHSRHLESLAMVKEAPRNSSNPSETNESILNDERPDEKHDDSASMSGFSEAASIYSSSSRRSRARAARMWSRRWKKEKQLRDESHSPADSAGVENPTGSIAKGAKSTSSLSRRKKKSSKDPRHDLELPTQADRSVASLTEGRQSLLALMQYDEADQDWL